MSRRASVGFATVMAVALALVWCAAANTAAGAAPEGSVSGAPSDVRGEWTPVPQRTPGLDDLLQPVAAGPPPVGSAVDVLDVASSKPAGGAPVPLWRRLDDIAELRRADAVIEIEPASGTAGPRAPLEVAALWNGGEHERAIGMLRAFEEAGGSCALGISWKADDPLAPLFAGDVRIGTLTNGHDPSLDFDAATGALFAVIRWTGDAGRWTVHRSVNGGASWSETFNYFSGAGVDLVDVSAAVVSDYVYVGYVLANAAGELRMRRCLVADGTADPAYFYQTILDASPATLTEVAVATNAEDFDNRVYALAIQSDHRLRFLWDVASDGTTFTDNSPVTTDASFGLDATWANDYACTPFLYATYSGIDDFIHLQGFDGATWTQRTLVSAPGMARPTSLSAWRNVIIAAYEFVYASGRGIQYSISYDCGATWSIGSLAVPGGAVSSYTAPHVDARDGLGTAIVYVAEIGEPDAVYFRFRGGFSPGGWGPELPFNDYDVLTGTPTTLAHLHAAWPNAFTHGAIYFNGAAPLPYFDRPGAGTVGVTPVTPADRLALRLTGAHPARGPVALELAMPQAGHGVVQVHDVHGSLVRELARGPFAAGRQPLTWDGRNRDGTPVGSGVYFVHVRTSAGASRLRVVMLR